MDERGREGREGGRERGREVLVTEMLVVAVEFVPLLVVLVKFIGGGNFISVTK